MGDTCDSVGYGAANQSLVGYVVTHPTEALSAAGEWASEAAGVAASAALHVVVPPTVLEITRRAVHSLPTREGLEQGLERTYTAVTEAAAQIDKMRSSTAQTVTQVGSTVVSTATTVGRTTAKAAGIVAAGAAAAAHYVHGPSAQHELIAAPGVDGVTIHYQFNEHSTGKFGQLRGAASQTAGAVTFTIDPAKFKPSDFGGPAVLRNTSGPISCVLNFNFNQTPHIKRQDLQLYILRLRALASTEPEQRQAVRASMLTLSALSQHRMPTRGEPLLTPQDIDAIFPPIATSQPKKQPHKLS